MDIQVIYGITLAHALLVAAGAFVGLSIVLKPSEKLLNKTLGAPPFARLLFLVHLVVCYAHLMILGPLALHFKSRTLFWSSNGALFLASLPIALGMNRTSESFGVPVGRFLVFRNVMELLFHVLLARADVVGRAPWAWFVTLHHWVWGYRLVDVFPRRLLRTRVGPWTLLAILIAIYGGLLFVVHNRWILYVVDPKESLPDAHATPWGITAAMLYPMIVYVFFSIVGKMHFEAVAVENARTEAEKYREIK